MNAIKKGCNILEKSINEYKQELLQLYHSRDTVAANAQLTPPNPDNGPQVNLSAPPPDEISAYNGEGGLTVALTHSRQTYPVAGALVTVVGQAGDVAKKTITDTSGKTPLIMLPAPSKIYSEIPGESYAQVAAFYTLKIQAQGFLPVTINGVPIFDGVNTTQPLDLTFSATAGSENPIVINLDNSYTL